MDIQKLFDENYIDLNEVCDSILDGVVISGAQKNFIFWNHAAKKILADGPDETDPQEWARRYRLYDRHGEKFLSYDQLPMVKALNGEEFYDYRIVTKNLMHPNGIVLSVNGKPIRSGNALVAGITTFRDVTAQVSQETRINNERNFYEGLLDLMPGIVFIKNVDGKFIYGNKHFRELLGTDSVIGKATDDYLVKKMVDEIKRHDDLVKKTLKAHEFVEVIYWENGEQSTFRTIRFPYVSPDGELKGVCAVAQDITKEIENQALIDEERSRSAEISKLASIGILSAEIAHEIKNPLMIMQSAADVIQLALTDDEIDKDLIRQKLSVLNDTISRMNKVSSSLNVLSRDASQEQGSSFTVRELTEDVRSLCMFKTRKMKMELTIIESADLDLILHNNRVQLSEVLLNLVMNALDAVEDVTSPEVEIKCVRSGECVLIKISDNGKGVDPSIRDKIFEPFFTTKPANKGTGLGLSISKKIVDKNHGELSYEDHGNKHFFVLKMPIGK